ncbi:Fpg/Nei family DNA glycosylase [Trueperella bialowiezensis]|uniref:DNA-(apurinic or apyrimidinic site) lyase n=1 Tax=Trueperella bialowiezensis TaxID=312285 RepID=A0A3S4Z5P8_9ACTO|nr:Fpg/Nei family DNA glycosylase [Trueperella bialowiezensis]VEI13560.1 DNA glycosylase/AP lyase Nei [Trueperella bialowiezensis]
MPEGHSIHRLARVLTELFAGQRVAASSPQGRFAAGAELVNGSQILPSQAWGKHLFIPFTTAEGGPYSSSGGPARETPFGPETALGPETTLGQETALEAKHATGLETKHGADLETMLAAEEISWVHVHLGLYGRWVFNGDSTFLRSSLLGVPHIIIGEGDEIRSAVTNPDDDVQFGPRTDSAEGGEDAAETGRAAAWRPPAPRGAVRLRILTAHGSADLSGPNQCEVKTGAEVEAVLDRLGPDPLHNNPGDREEFIDLVRRRRSPVGGLIMDQSVAAGPGNIYRAESLFRVGVHPDRPGNKVSRERLGLVWDDLVDIMNDGLATGTIQTIQPELAPAEPIEADPEASRWAVYHRTGRPCLRCGATVREKLMQGRRLFWCPGCQR